MKQNLRQKLFNQRTNGTKSVSSIFHLFNIDNIENEQLNQRKKHYFFCLQSLIKVLINQKNQSSFDIVKFFLINDSPLNKFRER